MQIREMGNANTRWPTAEVPPPGLGPFWQLAYPEVPQKQRKKQNEG
jgi:hypothetical protein